MKIALQIILTFFATLYLFAGLNNSRREIQVGFTLSAVLLIALVLITTTVL